MAFTYNRVTHAVMMATPLDLEDFAVGFSRAEGIVGSAADIQEFEIVVAPGGVELRMWIAPERMATLEQRRRQFAGAHRVRLVRAGQPGGSEPATPARVAGGAALDAGASVCRGR